MLIYLKSQPIIPSNTHNGPNRIRKSTLLGLISDYSESGLVKINSSKHIGANTITLLENLL